VASDLSRAHDTALQLAGLTGLTVQIDSDLRETFAGEWQGKTRAEIQSRWPQEFAAWGGSAGDVRD
jgi:probable phosphoglycerate mutase